MCPAESRPGLKQPGDGGTPVAAVESRRPVTTCIAQADASTAAW